MCFKLGGLICDEPKEENASFQRRTALAVSAPHVHAKDKAKARRGARERERQGGREREFIVKWQCHVDKRVGWIKFSLINNKSGPINTGLQLYRHHPPSLRHLRVSECVRTYERERERLPCNIKINSTNKRAHRRAAPVSPLWRTQTPQHIIFNLWQVINFSLSPVPPSLSVPVTLRVQQCVWHVPRAGLTK